MRDGSSLRQLLELEARVVIGTRFDADAAADTGAANLDVLAARLSEQLGVESLLPDECVGDAVVRVLHQLRPGQICILPDLSAQPGERNNDERFARALASNVDAYLGDAFASSHLEQASLVRVPQLLPRRALGREAAQELAGLSALLAAPRATIGWCVGGRRLSAKLDLLDAWLPKLGTLCVGGDLATTLLAAAGRAPETASAEPELAARARSLLARARDLGVELVLPTDVRIIWEGDPAPRVIPVRSLNSGSRVIDVGPESMEAFARALAPRQHLLWWGLLGDASSVEGMTASRKLVDLCAQAERRSIVLGKGTARYVRALTEAEQQGIGLVATGTAAALALLAGNRLPGIEALRRRG